MTKHEKIAEIGNFEIWKTPRGEFEVYSPTSRVGCFRSEDRARALIRFIAAHATNEATA